MKLADALGGLPAGAGPIGLLSSDEFTHDVEEFDRALLAAGPGPRIALVVAAAGAGRAAEIAAANGVAHYRRLGAEPVVVDVVDRGEAVPSALPGYDTLFMCGGSPQALLRTLRGSPLWDEALRRWRAGAGLAGSSAGAMALCESCQIPGPGDRTPTRWTQGLGPLSSVVLAVHASSRSKKWLEDVARNAPRTLVALDDKTGVVLTPNSSTVLGSGKVRVLAKPIGGNS